MLASDILVGNIYNVMFDPVESGEFNGKHLAVVLKKNNDKCTFIVMPLTSSSNGEGVNKKRLGCLSCLPTSLRSATTFAVYNQVRTVNASRFMKLKEGKNVVACPMPPNLISELLVLAVSEIVYGMEKDTKRDVLKRSYDASCIEHAKDLAYTVRRLTSDSSEEVTRLNSEIKETLKYTNVDPSVDFPNNIVSIIKGALE